MLYAKNNSFSAFSYIFIFVYIQLYTFGREAFVYVWSRIYAEVTCHNFGRSRM